MATYVLPQVLVFQDFRVSPVSVENPLRAHISGPHAKLIRYAETGERADGSLGYYDRLLDTDYAWPNRPAGAIADISYVKLWMKDALLKYFEDTISQGSVITKLTGYNNRIRSATINFAENGDDYPRAAALLDRDVKAGDIAKVRGFNSDGDAVTLWTYVRDVIGDTVAATVAAATADSANPASQGTATSVTKIAGVDNCVSLAPDVDDYDGLPSGDITETYDILVLEGSANGDFTTAKLRVLSGSGDDDVAAVTPAAAGLPTTIGTRGLQVTFDASSSSGCSASASIDDVSPDDLIAGQRWQISVQGVFSKPVATSGGAYDGASDTTYIVTVSRGGLYTATNQPQIKVTTTNGVDLSGPTTVTAAGTAVAVGTQGVTVSFSGTGLRLGDRYYIEVTAEAEGAMRNIELGHNLDTDIAAGSEVDLTLFIKKPLLQIEQNRTGFAPLTNWDTSATQLTVNSGIVAYDATWTDDGVQQALDVWSESSKEYGKLYVEVRYWLNTLADQVNSLDDVGDIGNISGALHPDNPLKWGVFKALENSNGTAVKYTAVADPDDADSWADVLNKILGRDDVYGLVPLTRNRTVLDLYAAHVTSQSSPEQALWRVLWVNLEGVAEIPIVSTGSQKVPGHSAATTTDGEVALGVVEDDADTTGTQYTILRCTSANADFITNGVKAGDIVRLLFTGDGFGGSTYSEYVVDAVQAEDQLRLLTGPDAAISVAAKFEVWRNLTATDEASEIAENAGAWGSRRVRAVWPDTIEASGTIMPGYFLCAALAGLSSGVLPHQGLTQLEITGFSDVPRTTDKFNRAQLAAMALGGAWIVTQELSPTSGSVGRVFTRQAVTTGSYDDINQREEMITRNVDSISYRFKDQFAPFIGVTNVTPTMQARLLAETQKLIDLLRVESSTQELGGQLISAEIVELRPHAVFKDRFVLKLNCDVPESLNVFEVHLVI